MLPASEGHFERSWLINFVVVKVRHGEIRNIDNKGNQSLVTTVNLPKCIKHIPNKYIEINM
jgi:hypothetical protein